MRTSIPVILAAVAGITSASPAATTTTSPYATCVYEVIASATAYAANMPNKNLTEATIEHLYSSFEFACEAPSNFTAHLLQTSTTTPKPWFGAGWYQGTSQCTASNFAGIPGQCMLSNNPNGNSSVTCVPYTGSTSTPFQKAAGSYFSSLKA